MSWRPKCLHFMLASGEDVYLYPISEFLKAINRKDRETVVSLEKKKVIPLEYQIFVKTKKHQAERYYTQTTITKMRKWFANNKYLGKRERFTHYETSSLRPVFDERRIEKIHKLFRAEFEKFRDARFIGRVSQNHVPELELSREKAGSVARHVRFIGDEELFQEEKKEDFKSLDDWSY